MANQADLLIRVLADTTSAHASFGSMGTALAAALGMGAAGGAGVMLAKLGSDVQSSMAKVQQAYNNVDFAPGTQGYIDATNTVMKMSGTLATNFEEIAASMAQASKVTDEYGNKLPTSKIDEFVEANLRLKASSQDSIDALTSGQNMAMLSKMYSSTDYKGTASMVAALTTQHPQSEATLWQAALGIGRIGAPLGVTEAQALGVGNYLSDVGAGGERGGASIGRMLLRMDTSADAVLNPESRYAEVKQKRDASEKLDDLQESLAEAEAKRSEMYGQHGLKKEYRQHPSEVMAANARIAKLQREIADQAEDITHLNDPERSWPRGKMNMPEMAKTAGMDATAYAELFRANPIDALLAFTSGMHDLDKTQRGAAMTKAGVIQTKDQATLSVLSDQPKSVRRMIALAEGEQANPTAIDTISNIGLGTTESKFKNMAGTARAMIAADAGERGRAVADAGITRVQSLIESGNWSELEKKIGDAAGKFDMLNNVLNAPGVGPVLTGFGMAVGAKVLAGGGVAGVAGVAGAAGGVLAGGAGALAALGLGVALPGLAATKDSLDKLNEGRAMVGLPPITVNLGDIHADAGLDAVVAAVTAQLTTAWKTAMQTKPVSGAMAGNYATGSGPR
jgi:hypothetical protein